MDPFRHAGPARPQRARPQCAASVAATAWAALGRNGRRSSGTPGCSRG